mmetsp:Transcript_3320/g.9358  ORF Transcript_3320/g.9358 Transcript_3320/m.9358 type:complete len:263 (-) Transcript_3320:1242-2030(-)
MERAQGQRGAVAAAHLPEGPGSCGLWSHTLPPGHKHPRPDGLPWRPGAGKLLRGSHRSGPLLHGGFPRVPHHAARARGHSGDLGPPPRGGGALQRRARGGLRSGRGRFRRGEAGRLHPHGRRGAGGGSARGRERPVGRVQARRQGSWLHGVGRDHKPQRLRRGGDNSTGQGFGRGSAREDGRGRPGVALQHGADRREIRPAVHPVHFDRCFFSDDRPMVCGSRACARVFLHDPRPAGRRVPLCDGDLHASHLHERDRMCSDT